MKSPVRFSRQFSVSTERLARSGVFDPTLNCDAKLFIDPLLLEGSQHPELATAKAKFSDYFGEIIKLLDATRGEGDLPWRTAEKKMQFSEIRGTCLGYGGKSIRGHGIGPGTAKRLTKVAHEIVTLGITDPDLFLVLPLLEKDVGPDLISDMTTHIIFPNLLDFNARIIRNLKLPTSQFKIAGERVALVENPLENRPTPIILLPTDILRDLPVANDWDEVCDAAAHNQQLRTDVNHLIGNIWKVKTRKNKDEMKDAVLRSHESFEMLLSLIHRAEAKPYEIENDPEGLFVWRRINETISSEYPLEIRKRRVDSVGAVFDVVDEIVRQFRFLIEHRGLWQELWYEGKRRPERSVQLMFFAVSDSYCRANDLDISPEVDTGTGRIDFKLSSGYKSKVIIEVKMSDNPRLIRGYERQIERYIKAEPGSLGIYLVINVGGMGEKDEKLIQIRNERIRNSDIAPAIEFVDGMPKSSDSKL